MVNLYKSFYAAFVGLYNAFKQERNIKIHVSAAVIISIIGLIVEINSWQWVAQTLVIGLVISLEMVNTAIEELTDLVSPEYSRIAGKVKDIAAGAVLFAAITSVIVGCLIYAPIILNVFATMSRKNAL